MILLLGIRRMGVLESCGREKEKNDRVFYTPCNNILTPGINKPVYLVQTVVISKPWIHCRPDSDIMQPVVLT
jgi:hypothetical protein